MPGNGQLERCRQRKEELLRTSAANRRALELEAPVLRNAAGWVDAGIDISRNARKAWDMVAPLLALGLAGQRKETGFLKKVLNGVSLARSAVALWKHWRNEKK